MRSVNDVVWSASLALRLATCVFTMLAISPFVSHLATRGRASAAVAGFERSFCSGAFRAGVAERLMPVCWERAVRTIDFSWSAPVGAVVQADKSSPAFFAVLELNAAGSRADTRGSN